MANAREAREWAKDALRGIGDSLYTPFSGPDGDAIDWDAYRTLIRYCVGELKHPMLWPTSGLAEFWSLTIDERKKLLEVCVEEARAINPKVIIQANTASTCAKDCLELTLHAQENGADIVYIQTPMMEVHAGEGVLRFFQYIADRTDIALGLFNSGSSGYMLSPEDVGALYKAIPAICAMKDGTFRTGLTPKIHALAPDMQLWECDTLALTAGWAAKGMIVKSLLGTSGYMFDYPGNPRGTIFYELLWAGKIDEAIEFGSKNPEIDAALGVSGKWLTAYPQRPGYFTHWGEVQKYGAELMGLPVGDYGLSRPPQGVLPQAAKDELRIAFEKGGLIDIAKAAAEKWAPQKQAIAAE